MKKALLLLSICLLTLSITAKPPGKGNGVGNPMTGGIILMSGGAAMALGAFLTPIEYQWVGTMKQPNQSSANNGTWEPKPFYAQGARFYGVCGGVTLTITGLITTLSNRK